MVFAFSVLRHVLWSLIGCPFLIRFPCVLGRAVKFWRPSRQLLGFPCPVQTLGVLFFLLWSFFVCLRRHSSRLVLSLAQRCVEACCLSIGVLGGSTVRIRGWCWFCGRGMCFLFAVLCCLSSTSQGCVPIPVCHGGAQLVVKGH